MLRLANRARVRHSTTNADTTSRPICAHLRSRAPFQVRSAAYLWFLLCVAPRTTVTHSFHSSCCRWQPCEPFGAPSPARTSRSVLPATQQRVRVCVCVSFRMYLVTAVSEMFSLDVGCSEAGDLNCPFAGLHRLQSKNLACTGSQPSEAPWRLFCTTNNRFHSHTAAAAAQACAQPCRGHIEAIVGATQTRFAYACSNQRSARHAVVI